MGGDLRAESGARLHPFPIRNQSVLRPMRWIKLLQGAASCLASGWSSDGCEGLASNGVTLVLAPPNRGV